MTAKEYEKLSDIYYEFSKSLDNLIFAIHHLENRKDREQLDLLTEFLSMPRHKIMSYITIEGAKIAE